jgi:hypothetical protein
VKVKEIRAVVLGLLVVLLVAIAIAVWRRPARELRHVRGFRVEIQKTEGGRRKHVSFHVPISLIARIASFVPMADLGSDFRADWEDRNVTARDILDAADRSTPGQPGEIKRDHASIEVTAEGSALEILVKDEWGKTVRVRVPRSLVESLSSEKRISPREILRRLDELGPGDIVVIRDRDDEVTITAEPR